MERSHGFAAGCPLARENVSPAPVCKHYSGPWEEAPARCRTLRFLCDFTQATWQTAQPVCFMFETMTFHLLMGFSSSRGQRCQRRGQEGGTRRGASAQLLSLTPDARMDLDHQHQWRDEGHHWSGDASKSHLPCCLLLCQQHSEEDLLLLSLSLLLKARAVVELPAQGQGGW